MIYFSNSSYDTINIANNFATDVKCGDVICLNGDLGTGKTLFVQAMIKKFGVGEYVNSPTFTIVNEYEGDEFKIYHFDVYRIDDYDAMYDIGYEEYIYSDAVSIIEWAEKIKPILPKDRYDIYISRDLSKNDNYREIRIEKRGD